MPYTIIDVENDKAREILQRWQSFSITHHAFGSMIGFFFMSFSNTFMSKKSPNKDIVFWIGALLCLYGFYGAYITRRRFVAEMTIEEIEILQRAAVRMSKEEKKTIKSLVHRHQKIHPQREYLRAASQPEQTETLLHAAHYTTETPQDQLLRPTNGEKDTP